MRLKRKLEIVPSMVLAATVLAGVAGVASTPSQAGELVAWTAQSGSQKYTVLFDGKVYRNRWWVESSHCPADAASGNDQNAWQFQRKATPEELKTVENPKNCDAASTAPGTGTAGGGEGNFDREHIYRAGDIVSYNGQEYKAAEKTRGIFVPGELSVWKEWVKAVPWQRGQVYKAGHYVTFKGKVYMAQWWTRGEIPTMHIGNGVNGQVWLPRPDYVELNPASVEGFQPYATYQKDDPIRYRNKIYVASRNIAVEGVSPETKNPWKVYINWTGVKAKVGESPGPWPKHFFAPYIDASLGYVPNMAEYKKNTGTDHFTLAFLVNSDSTTCSYAWGGVSSVKNGPSGLYANIKALRRAGGDVMVSIGGANNNPLAKVCTDVDELKTQYRNIVENLNLSVLDFDIEGGHVADRAAIERRSKALKMLQDEFTAEGKDVPVWITLPVLPTGLTADGVNVVRSAFAHGVKLAGVNLMTMDYGGSMGCQSMNRLREKLNNSNSDCDIDATRAVHGQIKKLAGEFHLGLSDKEIWSMLGATPMIGVNDQDLEVFFLNDAQKLRAHAENRGLGMLSMWSVARDRSAPAGQVWQVSPSHSGLPESEAGNRAFSREFARFDPENPSTPPVPESKPPVVNPTPKPPVVTPVPVGPTPVPTLPSVSVTPYKEGTAYKEGDKVSSNGAVYQCKSWPFTGWCSGDASVYGPGIGWAWNVAWTKIK